MSCSSAARRAVLAAGAELVGHHRRQVRALDRVREHVLAVAGAELQPAEQLGQLGVEALDVGVEARPARPARRCGSRARTWPGSRSPRSAPGGCARPGAASRASSARSRGARRRSRRGRPRSGVSSMMKSTPVRFSSARMLRPSRPMMRPFMSSAGSWTTDTVVSAAWPAARRCMTTERMLRTRRSASRLVSSSICAQEPGRVVADLVLELLEQELLGLRRRQARDALERAHGLLADLGELRLLCSRQLGARARVELGRRARRAPPRGRAGAPRGAPVSARRVGRLGRRRQRPAAAPGAGARRGAAAAARAASPAARPRPPGRPPERPPRSRFPLPCPLPDAGPVGRGASSFTGLFAGGRPSRPGRAEETSRKAAHRPPPSDGGCDAVLGRCLPGAPARCGV